jgi:hypothetical protein
VCGAKERVDPGGALAAVISAGKKLRSSTKSRFSRLPCGAFPGDFSNYLKQKVEREGIERSTPAL